MEKVLGIQLLVELYGCEDSSLTKREFVEEALQVASLKSNTHSIGSFFHQFHPHGVSGVIVIEESHYTIHTWPEYGYAAVDFFYCSDDVEIDSAINVLKEYFKPKDIKISKIKRGIVNKEKVLNFKPKINDFEKAVV